LRLGVRQDEASFVYTREDGEAMQPRSLTHAWQEAIGATGLPRIRFHDLRHAHASARERHLPEGRLGTARALADRHHD
jgi:integrase